MAKRNDNMNHVPDRPLDPPDYGHIAPCAKCGEDCELNEYGRSYCQECMPKSTDPLKVEYITTSTIMQLQDSLATTRRLLESFGLMECPYCGEIALPSDGGECAECRREVNFG